MSINENTDATQANGTDGVLSFTELLDVLGFTNGEFVSICHKPNSDGEDNRLRAKVRQIDQAHTTVAALPVEADIYFGVNPVPNNIKGRGKNGDVTRLSSLYVDLDFSEGKCGDINTANAIIDDLSKILGTSPSAITHSGGGLHPYWPIAEDEDDDADDENVILNPSAFLSRWKRLVNAVAKSHSAKVDSVFDLARILRVPGTFNNKAATNGHGPIPVICHRGSGVLLRLGDVHKRFDEYGIHDIPNYPDPEAKRGEPGYAKILSNPEDWTFADSTCNYITETIRGWGDPNTVEIGTGRHPWLLAQAIRLKLAKRLECLTEADYDQGKDAIVATFKYMLANREPTRPVAYGEIQDIFDAAEAKAATKTDDEAREELGGHKHEPEIDEEAFWDSRQWLRDLRQFARSRRVGPWGMLGCVLVRILSTIPPGVVLPALVGGYASVNTFIAICGDPASSKSALMKAAEDFLIINGVDVPTYNPGSSEAIPKSFAHIQPAKKATNTQPAVPAQQIGLAWSIVFAIPEIETLLEQNNGNAILAALRSIWSAESSSRRYAGQEHNVRIMPHRARCNVILGVQWDFGDVFFGSIGAGTPQRIIYLPSRDTEQTIVKPKSPDPIVVPVWPNDDGTSPTQLEIDTRNAWLSDQLGRPQDNFIVLTIPQIATDEVDNGAMYRSGPEELDDTDPLDGHLLLAREKIAVAFAVMDGIFNGFDDHHWELSGVVILKSKQTRKILYRKVNESEARKRNIQAKYAGISRHKAEVAFSEQQDKGTARVAKFILGKLSTSEWSSKKDIKNVMASRDKAFFDPAIEELGDRIEIEEKPNAKGSPTTYYRQAL